MLQGPARKADINHTDITFRRMRKSSASYLASENVNQAHLESHHGWTRGSDVASRYIAVFGEANDRKSLVLTVLTSMRKRATRSLPSPVRDASSSRPETSPSACGVGRRSNAVRSKNSTRNSERCEPNCSESGTLVCSQLFRR